MSDCTYLLNNLAVNVSRCGAVSTVDMSSFLTLLLILIVLYVVLKIYFLLTHRHCKSKVCLVGKTALVTGGNSGIGYQIVLALVQRGCRVIIADKVEDENLLENVFKETRSRNVVFKYLDLSSFKSTKDLANDVIKDEGRLDILVNNAGIGRNVPILTDDGLDVTMQVNYFSAFLLTQLLEDLLKKSRGRIIFTSSLTSYFHNLSRNDPKLVADELSSAFDYANSKLCLVIIADKFAEKLKQFGVTSNAYHPGVVHTSIFQRSIHIKGKINFAFFVIKMLEIWAFLFGKTPEEGAQTAIHLACANEVEDVTGKFFFEAKETFKPRLALHKKTCDAVWEATEEIVKSKLN